jgi:hypothetical protein
MFDFQTLMVASLIIGVLIILGYTIWRTPLMKSVVEGFATPAALTNISTDCPAGSTMYMFEGTSFCCSGKVNQNADVIKDTCILPVIPPNSHAPPPVFCTLGPTTANGLVKNCMETKAGLFQARGEQLCPSTAPNYVQGLTGSPTEGGRCCASLGNSDLSDCEGSAGQCDVSTDKNVFKNPDSCQFRRAQEAEPKCPRNYGPFKTAGQGKLTELTLFGCTDSTQNCYSKAVINSLKELGYDPSALKECSAN